MLEITSYFFFTKVSKNPITCVSVSEKFLFVGRESGFIQKFNLSTGTLIEVYLNGTNNGNKPAKISINSNAT